MSTLVERKLLKERNGAGTLEKQIDRMLGSGQTGYVFCTMTYSRSSYAS